MPYSMPTEPLCHPHSGPLFSPCIKKIVKPILVNLFLCSMLTVSVTGSSSFRAAGLIVGDLGVLVMESEPEERLL